MLGYLSQVRNLNDQLKHKGGPLKKGWHSRESIGAYTHNICYISDKRENGDKSQLTGRKYGNGLTFGASIRTHLHYAGHSIDTDRDPCN